MSRRQGVASRRARAGAPRARASSPFCVAPSRALLIALEERHQLPSTYNRQSSHTATDTTYDRYQKLAQRNTSPTPLRAAGGTGASRATARGVAPLSLSPLAPYPLISIHALHLLSTTQTVSISQSVHQSPPLHPPHTHTQPQPQEREGGVTAARSTHTHAHTRTVQPQNKTLSPASAKEHTLTRAIPTTTPVRAIARGGK